ncbi:Pls/PosA family non-ribosomal peptide synthetase [Saccharopolyspora rosea]|uniref:Pls/PosA family non-ribosomal peptide synthetase n=1 Tax=Saccharopolyspora rosea TaxID=524884 RepID=A0ABW3FS84_9PSEU|nr:Pls/PosA family non-ribosomal peptide synthetase [Saccharopolyspora rosea]
MNEFRVSGVVTAHPSRRPQPRVRGHEPRTPAPTALHHVFEATCDVMPTAIAVECGDRRLTYRELDERANALAHHLRSRGVGVGARVGIMLRRSVRAYVALLAVLKTGAAYVPIDPAAPPDRIEFIAADAELALLLVDAPQELGEQPCPVVDVERAERAAGGGTAERPRATASGDPACYVIYTSGSTGRPKGVEVAQSSICNFVEVATHVYGVRSDDRVYQGMTLAFDFSIEEIWPAWAVGATVVAGPDGEARVGPGLAEFLRSSGVTVLCCVPTVLATVEDDLPALRTLLVGGEACPAELVERWSRPGRRMLNTYGPTETTVTATWAELRPGRPVTIGTPMPTYRVEIRDDADRLVPDGEVGEICVRGVGVARRYLNRPELTAEKFRTDAEGRYYRTGDLGRVLPGGEIEYLGRADSEVKVRGHRVDLQEVESLLLEHGSVGGAVVRALPGGTELAAYVTRSSPEPRDGAFVAELHDGMRRRLPPYMVPAYVEVLDALPMLPSGKVDRSALPDPVGGRLVAAGAAHEPPATPVERAVAEVWAQVLNLAVDELSVHADFFTDLGGHSLLATTLVSRLRESGTAPALSVAALYANPTVRQLTEHLTDTGDPAEPAADQPPPCTHSTGRVAVAGTAQLAVAYVLALVFALPLLGVLALRGGRLDVTAIWQGAAAVAVGFVLLRLLLPVLACRLLTARLRPGHYPLWGATYLRVWSAQALLGLAPLGTLSGSPLLAPYLRLLGARVGARTHLAAASVGIPSLVEIGDDASVGYGARLETTHVEGGRLHVGPVAVGAGAFVGANAVLMPGARLGDGAHLDEQSLLASGQEAGAGRRWSGSPARRTDEPHPVLSRIGARSAAGWPVRLLLGFAVAWLGLELLPFLVAVPSLVLVVLAGFRYGLPGALVAAVVSGPLFVLTSCLVVAVGKRLVLHRAPVGVHPARTALGLRKHVADRLLAFSLAATNALYATLYTPPWLRALGARIGSRAEVSTVSHLDPDLLDLGDECFVADMASLGPATFHRGHVVLGRTRLEHRSFAGNAALARAGADLAANSLVGVHSVTPPEGTTEGGSWLGSPPMFLPRREQSASFADELTFRPGRGRVAERLLIEFFRIALPPALLSLALTGAVLALWRLVLAGGLAVAAPLAPVVGAAAALAVVLTVVLLKWVVVGRYRPRVEPLWSRFVRRTEFVTGLYESAAVPVLLGGLAGTPLLPVMLRLFGARIGRRVWLSTTYLTEFDLVRLGDDVAVGPATSLQTHLFEDRVMKMSTVTVRSGASVGGRSVVLYDGVVGRGAGLDALSLVMKGEHLEPGTRWRGIPCRAVG